MTSLPPAREVDGDVPAPADLNALASVRTVPGRRAVLAMLTFAIGMIALLFGYWELYTRPFRPLQAAIAAEFQGSSPRAIGGRHKSHLSGSPMILRLIVRIPWDPRDQEARARQTANRLAEIASRTVALNEYQRLEVFLMHRRPEQWTITWSLDVPLNELPIATDGPLPAAAKVRITEGVEGS